MSATQMIQRRMAIPPHRKSVIIHDVRDGAEK